MYMNTLRGYTKKYASEIHLADEIDTNKDSFPQSTTIYTGIIRNSDKLNSWAVVHYGGSRPKKWVTLAISEGRRTF